LLLLVYQHYCCLLAGLLDWLLFGLLTVLTAACLPALRLLIGWLVCLASFWLVNRAYCCLFTSLTVAYWLAC
jgi:hypothetical protein